MKPPMKKAAGTMTGKGRKAPKVMPAKVKGKMQKQGPEGRAK